MTARQVNTNDRWRNALIIIASTVIAFFAGGGWKFWSTEEMYGLWHNTHSDFEYAANYESMFLMWGIAQAITALLWSLLIIRLIPVWRRYLWLWSFLLLSLAFGGYKFFVSAPEYFIGPLAGKEIHSYGEYLFAPFLLNGGALGLLGSAIAGIVQWVRKNKASPNQGL